MTRDQHSKDKLEKAYKHIEFELLMLRATAALIQKPSLTDAADRAYLASFAIHARNLIEFLYNKTHPEGYFAPEDFLPAGTWQSAKPHESPIITDARQRAQTEIAHLTWDRLSATEKHIDWPLQNIVQEISAAFDTFAQLYHSANGINLALGNLADHNANCAIVMITTHFPNTATSNKETPIILDTPEQTP